MGLAWTAGEAGHPVLPGHDAPADLVASVTGTSTAGMPAGSAGTSWAAGHRHRRPTLLARGGQAVAHRITRLAGAGAAAGRQHDAAAHPSRRRAMAARKYWT